MDSPAAWALVSYLIHENREKFDIWRQAVDNDVEPRVAWEKRFGPVTPEFGRSLEGWLRSSLPPWQVISGEWWPAGDAIEGKAHEDDFAVAILNQTPREFRVSVNSTHSNDVAGVVFGFRGAKNFHVLQRSLNGRWDVMHYDGAYFRKTQQRTVASMGDATEITVIPDEGGTTLKFGGQTLSLANTTGRVGLWLKEGHTRFLTRHDQASAGPPAAKAANSLKQ